VEGMNKQQPSEHNVNKHTALNVLFSILYFKDFLFKTIKYKAKPIIKREKNEAMEYPNKPPYNLKLS
jgi:hypothetical protein